MNEADTAPTRSLRLSRTARRSQLLDAAREVFVHQGYHSAGMDDIADRAGVSKPVVYQHFPSKLDLYLALLTSYVDLLVDRVRAALSSTPDNAARIRAAVGAYFDFIDDTGQGYRLVFESDLRGEPAVAARVDAALERCIEAVAEAVIADAGLDAAQGRMYAVGLVGVSQVSARYWLEHDRPVPKEEAVAIASSLAWRGVSHLPLHP